MEINARLFAALREGRAKILTINLKSRSRVRDLLSFLSIREDDVAIILVNGNNATLDTVLKSKDAVSIFPPVGGG